MSLPDVERPAAAKAAADLAGIIIKALDAAFRGPARAQIEAAIRQWRKANGYP
jgi:hypothetical protein